MANQYLYNGVWSPLHNTVFLLAQGVEESSEYEHTLVYFNEAKQWKLDQTLGWDSVSINTDFDNEIIVIGVDGNFALKKGKEYIEGEIPGFPTLTNSYGSEKELFVVGMSSKIYKYAGNGEWELDVDGVEGDYDFSCISGGADILFVVGDKGVCYWRHRRSTSWQEENLPTNESLTSVSVNEEGFAIICGRNGTLLAGKQGIWEILEHDYQLDDFWSVKYINNKFFVAGNNGVYELMFDGTWKLEPIYGWDIAEHGIFSDMFYEGGNAERFWVVSEKGLSYMHANEWNRLL